MNGLHEAAHIDDRAAAHTRLMQVFDALERTDEADKHRILAKSAWGTYTNLQEDTVRMLSGLRENGVATL